MDIQTCRVCSETKPLVEFLKSKQRKNGYDTRCKVCYNGYRKEYLSDPETYKKHKAVSRASYHKKIDKKSIYIKFRYGLSEEQVNKMLAKYDGMCWSCREKPATCIDHDHKCCDYRGNTKTCGSCVRGMLCLSCNTGMGHFKDDPVKLQAAINYLNEHG